MIAIPALDLRDNACVQLVGGSYEKESVRIDGAASVARTWQKSGFRRLHLIDLDAATGRGSNAELVRGILAATELRVQVGGGIRTSERIRELLEQGASQVVVGTRAFEDRAWLEHITSTWPGLVIVAADVRERDIVTHGWTRRQPRTILSWLGELNDLPLGGILVTAVHKEGQMQGTDLILMEDVAEAAHVPIYAAGGIGGMSDLRALADRGVAAAIIGMALYTGAVDPRAAAEEFAE